MERPEGLIFCLKATNDRARKAVDHRRNRHVASDRWYNQQLLNFGSFTRTKDPNRLTTIATLGSSKRYADVYIKGNDIAPVHCALVVNHRTGVVLVEDRSVGGTRLYQNAGSTRRSDLHVARGRRRAVVMTNYNTILSLGSDTQNPVRFEFIWNYRPEDTLDVIQKRISGASENIRRRDLGDFRRQTPAKPGRRVRYARVSLLGRGGFGRVFKCVDVYSGDFLAVKLVTGNVADERWKRQSLKIQTREVTALQEIRHPYILPFLGAQGFGTDTVEMFMPVMQGNAGRLILGTVSATRQRAIGDTLLYQMLSALDYLKSRDIIHRDVKPDNILWEYDHTGNYHFQLSDFGLMNRAAVATSHVGTALYTAPEVYDSSGPQTKADVWSLFVTILWIYNERDFREDLDMLVLKVQREVRRAVLHSCIGSRLTRHIRDMGILDPKVRPTAGQMLFRLGRRDLMTTKDTDYGGDRFGPWMKTIREGNDPFSRYVITLLDE